VSLVLSPDLFVGDSMLVILQDTIKSTQSPKYRIEQKGHTYPLCIRTISFLRLPNSFFNSRLDASSSFNSTVLPVEACESQPVALVTSLYRLRPVCRANKPHKLKSLNMLRDAHQHALPSALCEFGQRMNWCIMTRRAGNTRAYQIWSSFTHVRHIHW